MWKIKALKPLIDIELLSLHLLYNIIYLWRGRTDRPLDAVIFDINGSQTSKQNLSIELMRDSIGSISTKQDGSI